MRGRSARHAASVRSVHAAVAFFVLVVLALLAMRVDAATAGDLLAVTLDEKTGALAVLRNGVQVWSGSRDDSPLVYADVEFLPQASEWTSTPAELAAAFPVEARYDAAAIELAHRLTTRTWLYVSVAASPRLSYSVSFTTPSSESGSSARPSLRLDCAPTWQYPSEGFWCSLVNATTGHTLAALNVSVPTRAGSVLTSSVAFVVGSVDAVDEIELAHIAMHRLLAASTLPSRLMAERLRNASRLDKNRFAVGCIYAIIAVSMCFAGWFCALWVAWMIPVFRYYPVITWTFVLSVSLHAFSWMGGFGAWVTVMGLLALTALVAPVVYFISMRKQSRRMTKTLSNSAENRLRNVGADRSSGACVFHRLPHRLSRCQVVLLLATFAAIAINVALCAIIVFTWKSDDFRVWDRRTNAPFTEFQPQLIAKTIAIMYAFEGAASSFRFDWMLQLQSRTCGVIFRKTLSVADRQAKIHDKFIALYSIDMSIYQRPLAVDYSSVNEWFIRELRSDVRPLPVPHNPLAVLSVADCRLTVFRMVSRDERYWLKTQSFSIFQLLGERPEISADFEGGSMAIFRLAPADYHRTHSPIAGTIAAQYKIESTLYSVNADAIRSGSGAIFNQRIVTVIDSGVPGRKVAFVAIGATCVGSVVMLKGVGSSLALGEDFSNFQFGGSTVVVLFPSNTLQFDPDLLAATEAGMEMLVRVRTRIGVWVD